MGLDPARISGERSDEHEGYGHHAIRRIGGSGHKHIVVRSQVNVPRTLAFRCWLAPGRYAFSAYAKNLAGNAQTRIGHNTLTVKRG